MIVCVAPQLVTKIKSGLHSSSSIDYSPRSMQLLHDAVIFYTLHAVPKSQNPNPQIPIQSRVDRRTFASNSLRTHHSLEKSFLEELHCALQKSVLTAPTLHLGFFQATIIFLLISMGTGLSKNLNLTLL